MNRALFSTGKDDWETPKDFYKRLDPYHSKIKQRIKSGELVGNRFRNPGE